jgi:hypothetical protein
MKQEYENKVGMGDEEKKRQKKARCGREYRRKLRRRTEIVNTHSPKHRFHRRVV